MEAHCTGSPRGFQPLQIRVVVFGAHTVLLFALSKVVVIVHLFAGYGLSGSVDNLFERFPALQAYFWLFPASRRVSQIHAQINRESKKKGLKRFGRVVIKRFRVTFVTEKRCYFLISKTKVSMSSSGVSSVSFESSFYKTYKQFLQDVFEEASALYHAGHDIISLSMDSYKGSFMQGPVESSIGIVMYNMKKTLHRPKNTDIYAQIYEINPTERYTVLVDKITNKADEIHRKGGRVISVSYDSYRPYGLNFSLGKNNNEYENSIAMILWES